MYIHQLKPKDKFDFDTASQLRNYSYAEIKPIVPKLLEWIQDMNWPVARTVADYLESISENLADEILKVLKGNDDIWKWGCLRIYLRTIDKINDEGLLNGIKRIASHPTKGEIEEDVNELAIELVGGIKNDPQHKINHAGRIDD
jgi:hypothetical protein